MPSGATLRNRSPPVISTNSRLPSVANAIANGWTSFADTAGDPSGPSPPPATITTLSAPVTAAADSKTAASGPVNLSMA